MADLLQNADQRRAWVIYHLMTGPRALEALEELMASADGLVEWADNADISPIREFAHRIRNDVEDALDGLLVPRASSVLNACRDLMEITVLTRDLRKDVQRLAKWLRSTEDVRRQEFGFGRELYMYPADPQGIPYIGDDRIADLTVYTVHSRTLHPAPETTDPSELSHDTPTTGSGAVSVHSWSYEICKHGLAALWQLLNWLLAAAPGSLPKEGEDFLPKDDGGLEKLRREHSAKIELIDRDAANDFMALYRNKRVPRDSRESARE